MTRPGPRHRRQGLRSLVLAPLLWPLGLMLERLRQQHRAPPQALPADLPLGLSVAGHVVARRDRDGHVQAWDARCTHLGCRLDRVIDGVLVCPCHGSRFDAEGRVLAGPATRPLKPMRVTPDAATGGWSVDAA